MNYLKPIHKNNSGIIYAVKSCNDDCKNVQLQIGDLGLILTVDDLPKFLKVIQKVKNKYNCSDCGSNNRVIKCDTLYASVKIKTTPDSLNDLEELISVVIHNNSVDLLLKSQNIQ